MAARLVRSAVPSVRVVPAKVAVEVVRQLRKAPGQLEVVLLLARRGYILVVMMLMCLLYLREVLVHVQLSGVVEYIRYQQVLVELDASSLRPGVVYLPQGERDEALRVYRGSSTLHGGANHYVPPFVLSCFLPSSLGE